MARILVVSAVSTHAPDMGNRFRVHQLVRQMGAMGHEVHFLYYAHPRLIRGDIPGMAAAWGDRFHLFEPAERPPARRPLRTAVRAVGSGLVRTIKHKVSYRAVRWLEERSSAVALSAHRIDPMGVDAMYDGRFDAVLRDLHRRHRFDAVMVVYFPFTKAFEAFGPEALRVLDAQDCFSQRTLDFVRDGLTQHGLFTVTRREEAKALRRADVILAITDEDRRRFERLVSRPVVTLGHLSAVSDPCPEPAAPVTLCVGSPYQMNADGVRWYLDKVFPRVRAEVPDAELWLAGGIGKLFPDLPAGGRSLGFVPDLGEVYRQAAVVLNPVWAGSGLAIKSVEALAAGRPLVATSCGARGLAGAAGAGALVLTDDPDRFAAEVIDLLRRPDRRRELAGRAREYAAETNRVNMQRLAAIIDNHTAKRPAAATA